MRLLEEIRAGKALLKKWRLKIEMFDPSGARVHLEEHENTICDGARYSLPFLLSGLLYEDATISGTRIDPSTAGANTPLPNIIHLPFEKFNYGTLTPFRNYPVYPTKMVFGDGSWDPDAPINGAFRSRVSRALSSLYSGDGIQTDFSGRSLTQIPVIPGTVTITANTVILTDVLGDGSLRGTGGFGWINYTTGEVFLKYTVAPGGSVSINAAWKQATLSSQVSILSSETLATGTNQSAAPYHKLPSSPIITKGFGLNVNVKGLAPDATVRQYIPDLISSVDNEIKFITLLSGTEGNGGNPSLGRIYNEVGLAAGSMPEHHNGVSWIKNNFPNNNFGSGVAGTHKYCGGWSDCIQDFIVGAGTYAGYSLPLIGGGTSWGINLTNYFSHKRAIVIVADRGSASIGGDYQVLFDKGDGTFHGDGTGTISAYNNLYNDYTPTMNIAITLANSATSCRVYFLDYNPGYRGTFDVTYTRDRLWAVKQFGNITKYSGYSLSFQWTLVG